MRNALTFSRNVRTSSQIAREAKQQQQSATSAYAAEATKACELIAKLEALVLEKDCIGRNWAEVGSLAHINTLLTQAVNHLSGKGY